MPKCIYQLNLLPTLRIPTLVALATLVCLVLAAVLPANPAQAQPHPSFRVVCDLTHRLPDDPIVFPGRPGASHMHAFFGNNSVNAHSTSQSLLKAGPSSCERHFDNVDHTGYWTPTLQQRINGSWVEQHGQKGRIEMAIYYKRAGGPTGALTRAMPQGLRMIAGDMHATTPQHNIWYKCMHTTDTGRQNSLQQSFPNCDSSFSLITEIQFPDCWDGRNLDSSNHKSHMAYSSGSRNTCPASHPVKIPKIFMETKWTNINGPPSNLRFSSGGAYSFHGDVFSAWNPRAMAGLVNYCINATRDCNPLQFTAIDLSSVTQDQIDAQLAPGRQPAPKPGTHHPQTDQSPARPIAQKKSTTEPKDDDKNSEKDEKDADEDRVQAETHEHDELAVATSDNGTNSDTDNPEQVAGWLTPTVWLLAATAIGLGLVATAVNWAYRRWHQS